MVTNSLNLNRDIILAMKRQYLKEREHHSPTESALALAQMQSNPLPILNETDVLEHPLILGQITRTEPYDPVTSALSMVRAGADGICFYTDNTIYQYEFEDMFLVARALKNTPVIYQNYILSNYGVTSARVANASGVVLYASILDAKTLRATVSMAQRWRMSVIVQANSFEAVEFANTLSPHVIAYGDSEKSNPIIALEELALVRGIIPHHTKVMLMNCLTTLDEVKMALEHRLSAVVVSKELLTGGNAPKLRALVGK